MRTYCEQSPRVNNLFIDSDQFFWCFFHRHMFKGKVHFCVSSKQATSYTSFKVKLEHVKRYMFAKNLIIFWKEWHRKKKFNQIRKVAIMFVYFKTSFTKSQGYFPYSTNWITKSIFAAIQKSSNWVVNCFVVHKWLNSVRRSQVVSECDLHDPTVGWIW